MAQNLGSLFAQNVSAGLGEGLQSLANIKMKEMHEHKAAQALKAFFPQLNDQQAMNISQNPLAMRSIFERGLIPQQGQQQQGLVPEGLMGQQQQQPQGLQLGPHPEERRHQETLKQQKELFGLKQEQQEKLAKLKAEMPSEADKLKVEARKDKLRPDLTYLDDLESTAKELRSLISNQKDPVQFGYKSSIASSIPVVGSQLLSGNTGAFDALSNKFHTDATQGAKNVRSKYHVQILGASKPSLNKTKEQNEKILDYWEKTISRKRSEFLKAHPEFKDESGQDMAQAQQQVDAVESSSALPSDLPDVSQFKEGDVIKKGNVRFKKVNGEWKGL